MPRQVLLCLLVVFIVTACNEESPKGKRGKETVAMKPFPEEKDFVPDIPPPPAPYTGPIKYCFEKREGDNGMDITTLHLTLDRDSITGTLDYLPSNRPGTHGTLEGVSIGNLYNLLYRYKDTVEHAVQVIYKFDNGKLYIKTGAMVEDDGVMVLENPLKSTFVLYMEKVDCK